MKNVLKLLIFSDVFLNTGLGLISPIMAIFIKENLAGGTIAAAGIASAIFLLVRSVLQIFIAKRFSQKDRLWLLLTGTFFITLVPILYIFSTSIVHIYLAQVFFGIAAAMANPAFMSLFILHADRKRPGYEWSIFSTAVSIGAGLSAYVGALLAERIGFRAVFLITSGLALIGALILVKLTKETIKKR